jgi:hypothetical protein
MCDSHNRRPTGADEFDFLRYQPGLLATNEMAQRSNPAFLKPVNRNKSSEAAQLVRTRAQRISIEVRSPRLHEDRIHLRRP